jgi:hypothetical protein
MISRSFLFHAAVKNKKARITDTSPLLCGADRYTSSVPRRKGTLQAGRTMRDAIKIITLTRMKRHQLLCDRWPALSIFSVLKLRPRF